MASNRVSTTHRAKSALSNLKGDYSNIAFLLLLYVLQGIPLGLSSAVPLLLQNRKVSYSDQALFSFVSWPFSLKLLWAPIVDSLYSKQIGRRKSWLIPTQLGIGLFMLVLSHSVNSLLSNDANSGEGPNIQLLTVIFIMLNFLAATQDIAVDGWALTMLSRRNVGYASTCNTAGQTAGFFIGNVIFLALESTDFCNKYLRTPENHSKEGIVTFEQFLHKCGIAFIIITILVALLKKEQSIQNQSSASSMKLMRRRSSSVEAEDLERSEMETEELNVKETYRLLYKIMKLPSFKLFAVILMTCKIGFSAPDAVSGLKLVEAGVHKENLALLAVPMVPLQIVLPWVISRITCGPRPLDLLIYAYPFRLLFGLIFPVVVYWTPMVKLSDDTFPMYYYLILIIIYAVHQVTVYSVFVSLMAFHAAVSDPSIGGTYMTLLNTITNLGGNWPATLSLWLVDKLSLSKCTQVCNNIVLNSTIIEARQRTTEQCETNCSTTLDGYYIECVICVIFGFLWLQWGAQKLKKLQSLPAISWSVASSKSH